MPVGEPKHAIRLNTETGGASGNYSPIFYATSAGSICGKSQADAKPCRFKINREILQQPVEPEQARKLLAARKTDLLDKFISKAGKPFPAFLVMDKKGKVTFDFPERD
jgi:DNA topoisomerase-3